MKRYLVTGSAGLIGGHLAREIERRDPDAYVQRVDILNGHDARRFFASNDDREWDAAFHCAAITGGIEGTTYNSAFQGATNAQLDGAYFEWALRCRPGRIVYFSSSCAYPLYLIGGENYALKESDIDFDDYYHEPDNVYGWCKLNGEVMANAVRETGVPTTVVRPFAIVGETQELCRMIPAFVQRAVSDDDTMEVWGEGDQASDFVHADDLVGAVLTAVEQGIDGPFNICTGRGAGADEVAKMVMHEVGVKKEIVHNLSQPSGPRWRVGDPTFLESFFKPQISLEETVRRIVASQR